MSADPPSRPLSCVVLERPSRRPGRPRAPEPSTPLTTWIPLDSYDKLVAEAGRDGHTLSSLVKSILLLHIRPR